MKPKVLCFSPHTPSTPPLPSLLPLSLCCVLKSQALWPCMSLPMSLNTSCRSNNSFKFCMETVSESKAELHLCANCSFKKMFDFRFPSFLGRSALVSWSMCETCRWKGESYFFLDIVLYQCYDGRLLLLQGKTNGCDTVFLFALSVLWLSLNACFNCLFTALIYAFVETLDLYIVGFWKKRKPKKKKTPQKDRFMF